MKHVVSFSGGRTSAYLVHLMEQKRINDGWDVEYVFMDTGAEHPKTYEFIRNVVSHFGIKLTCLKSKISEQLGVGPKYEVVSLDCIGWDLAVWKSMTSKHGNPYIGGAFCTERLKYEPFRKYCVDHFGKGNYTTWLGIRVDEKRRLKAKAGFKYLAEISSMTKHDIIGWWREQRFDLEIEDWLGNCVFCFKKSLPKISAAMLQEPELLKQWKEVIDSSDVRQVRNESERVIYRGKLDIDSVLELNEGRTVDQVVSSIRLNRGCAVEQGESCELFGCQMDMFADDAA